MRLDVDTDRYSREFISMIDMHHFSNIVNQVTSRSDHMLDLVLCDSTSGKVQHLEVEPDFSISPCHKLITFDVNVWRDVKAKKTIVFRYKGKFDSKILVDGFMDRLGQEFQNGTCPHVAGTNRSLDTCLSCMSHLYRNVLQGGV